MDLGEWTLQHHLALARSVILLLVPFASLFERFHYLFAAPSSL